MTASRPLVWLGEVRWAAHSSFDVTCYDHGCVTDPTTGDDLMPRRRARQVRRQHLSDFHARRWLWADERARWAWEERP